MCSGIVTSSAPKPQIGSRTVFCPPWTSLPPPPLFFLLSLFPALFFPKCIVV